MSPKPFSLDHALATLRGERSSPEAAARARAALQNSLPPGEGWGGVPPRRRLARPLAATMIATALALVVFMPRTHAGAAWAQTLAASFDAVPTHTVERDAKGYVTLERWVAGRKRAWVLYDKSHKPAMERRDDGQRLYSYGGGAFYNPKNPNSRPWAFVSRSSGNDLSEEAIQGSSEVVLKQPGVEVVEHQEASGGRPETYRLRVPRPYAKQKEELVAELEPGGRRIVRVTRPGFAGGETIDYPASIPASVFAPRPQAIPVPDVFDMKRLSAQIEAGVSRGLGKQGPVTLRAVLLTGWGELWVLWTGALPDSRLSHPFSVPSVECGPAFGLKIFTKAWRQSPKMNGVPVATPGPRLGGMGRTPLVKLGSTVDLDVPYPGGVAHFRNVRYVRVGYLQHVSALLGAKRDYR